MSLCMGAMGWSLSFLSRRDSTIVARLRKAYVATEERCAAKSDRHLVPDGWLLIHFVGRASR